MWAVRHRNRCGQQSSGHASGSRCWWRGAREWGFCSEPTGIEKGMHFRRESDRDQGSKPRWDFSFLASPASLRAVNWDDQRSQFVTRYLFWAIGLAYFNLGAPVARSAEFLLAVNLMCLVYVLLITVYLAHARRNMLSPR